MPRKKYVFLPGHENRRVDCFAFYLTKSGRPACRALKDIYCLKEYERCAFYAPPAETAEAAKRAERLKMRRESKNR